MKRVAFYTLGCKVNQYETESMLEMFTKAGYKVVDFEDFADVYVINTCTVTGLSARKSRQIIRRARSINSHGIIAVVGCYAQTAPDEVEGIEGVNLIIGTKDRSRILDYIREIEEGREKINAVSDIMHSREFEDLKVTTYKERTRAYLKIQDGCSQFCSYCIIPYARGPIRSRDPEDILEEVKKLAEGGFKEIVLTGIHVASYGKDLRSISLVDLIKKVHAVDGISRIRLGSIEPTTITHEFVAAAKEMDKLCPHYHISLQSGCNETLKRMNRKYTIEEYRRIVELLRENIKDVALTTDVMVGFPGETDQEFEQTFKFLDEISFAKMHIFKYSPRKGTPAATFEGQISPEKKDERSERLIELSDLKGREFIQGFVGRTLDVLFEQEVKDREGLMEGLTANYIRVLAKGGRKLKGEIRPVELTEAFRDHIYGEL